MQYDEMAQRVRHDLIKHLEIPNPAQELDSVAASVLLRRIFDSGSGVCAMCKIWGFKLRKESLWNDSLENQYRFIEQCCDQLASHESGLRKALIDGGVLDENIRLILKKLADAVRQFELLCESQANESSPSMAMSDSDAAMAFFDFDSPGDSENAPSLPIKTKDERLHVLVVDDRMVSIDRLQGHKAFRNRFTWVTRCHETCDCMDCPRRDQCDLRRSSDFEETVDALKMSIGKGKRVDALLMDVRFDDLRPDQLVWIPELPHLNHEDHVKALQGLIIARRLRQMPAFRHIAIVLMTARSRLPEGASSLLEGLDGLQFVDDDDSLDVLAARLESVVRMSQEAPEELGYFWGSAPGIQQVRRQIEIMSQGPRTVYITGPSGSGKSSLVERIIYPLSGRKRLITLDLSSVPDTLVESELFGHVKGAYSGATHDRVGLIEEADNGILFLDEIGNLSLENQRKLLLFLQDKMVRRVGAAHESRRKVDVKVVVATHLDLAQEVAAGRFRFDLLMRFGPAMKIALPSLDERREDLPQLVEMLVKKIILGDEMKPYLDAMRQRIGGLDGICVEFSDSHAGMNGSRLLVRFKPATSELFMKYHWPGNTRELESVLDTLILKAFYDLQVAGSKSRLLEIDHYYALSLLGEIDKASSASSHEAASQANDKPVSPAFEWFSGKMADFAELRQTLEKRCLCDIYQQCDGDLGRMGMVLFGDDSESMKHRISVRFNQLGLRIRSLKKK